MSLIDVGLYAGYLLVGLCTLIAVVMPLIQSFDDPKSLTKSAIGVVAIVVIFGVGYALSDANAPGTTAATSKFVGAGLISTYIFFGGAILGIIYTEISKIIK